MFKNKTQKKKYDYIAQPCSKNVDQLLDIIIKNNKKYSKCSF